MEPHKFSVLDLFNKPERYVVPLYQRRYIWTQGKQWRPLWDDIRSKVEEVTAKAGLQSSIRPHFLGAIVVARREPHGQDLFIYDVVDGQQRLTTFQIFLLAFRDQVREMDGLSAFYGRLRFHTRNGNEDMAVKPDEQYKVWPTRFDQPLFKDIWGHENPQQLVEDIRAAQHEHQAIGNLKAAYAYFSGVLRPWLAEDPSRAEQLFNTLKQHLQVVRIDLMPGDDPQVIFETLNARGEPLQAADLVRNFIFQQVERQHLDVEQYFQTYWAAFDEDRSFWRELVSRGRVRRDQLTWFLAYFLTAQHARDISEGSLFEEFKLWWNQQESPSLDGRLNELQRYAQAYLKLVQAAPDSRLGLLVHRLEALDTTTLTPTLLFLLTHDDLPSTELDAILLQLESYLVRRFTCGLTSKNYNQRFLTLLSRLKGTSAARQQSSQPASLTAGYVRAFLSEGVGDSARWPDDQEFLDHLLHDPLYRTIKPRGVVMLLEAAELTRHTDRQEKLLYAGKSSVEHVMPRRWETHWEMPTPVDGLDTTALVYRRNHLLHTLGNLTLLTSKLNSSLSNSAFENKKKAITKQTLRLLNSDFQDVDQWNELLIEERSKTLAQSLLGIWPAPQPSPAQTPSQPPADTTPVTDNLSIFDQWLQGAHPQPFRAEAFEDGDAQGVQFVPRRWSRSWKVRVYAHEQAGEDRLTLEIRDDFGENEASKPLARKVFSQLLEPLRLSFGDLLEEHAEQDLFTLHLDPNATTGEIQAVVNRVMALFIPRIAQALTPAPVEGTLDTLTQTIWPDLPDGYYFMTEDAGERPYRRIPKAGWAAPTDLHYEIGQTADHTFIVALHDEMSSTHPLKEQLRARWSELHQTAQHALGHPVQVRQSTTTQRIETLLPGNAPHQEVAAQLRTLMEATDPLLKTLIK